MEVYQAVTKRRSIRAYKDTMVPYDVLEKCVAAARLAPTAMNRQLCEYIIVDDEALVSQVVTTVGSWGGKVSPGEESLKRRIPKAYVVILMNKLLEAKLGGSERTVRYDAGMAAENMILVALEEGLGSCAMTSFKAEKLKIVLNIPDDYEIAMVVALGYPDENPVLEVATGSWQRWVDSEGVRHVPKRKVEDIVYRNRFPSA